MRPVITSDQMKRLDTKTINEFGIPARVLMENAGKGCADLLVSSFDEILDQGVVVLCGPGNNGGDGYVIARWLYNYGYDVTIISTGEGKSSPENKANQELCKKMHINIITPETEDYNLYIGAVLNEAGTIIDALFGIGFKGNLDEKAADLIELANEAQGMKVAIDIPSGVNADTGQAESAFQADLTLTMAALKLGHLLGQGKKYSGMVNVVPIGIPDFLWDHEQAAILLDEVSAGLPPREANGNKGDFGRVAVFAGSPGLTGAAFMASMAALKAGVGLVTIYCYPDDFAAYYTKPYEVMVKKTPLQTDGKLDATALAEELSKTDVILFGPGCGVNAYTQQILSFLADNWSKPAVIDADGLNTLANMPELYAKLADKPIILTPHWGEFCRLANVTMDALYQDCLALPKAFAGQYKLKVLLKSSTSIYYDTKTTYINTSGNDGLATGGSGDILAGLIAGLMAQKIPIPEAAGSAAYYLGLTAELLADIKATRSITPGDILDYIFRREEVEDEEINI